MNEIKDRGQCCGGGKFGEPHVCEKGTEVFGGNPISISSWKRTPVTATLRDQFAMAALTGRAGDLPHNIIIAVSWAEAMARNAYILADAMIKARKDK